MECQTYIIVGDDPNPGSKIRIVKVSREEVEEIDTNTSNLQEFGLNTPPRATVKSLTETHKCPVEYSFR